MVVTDQSKADMPKVRILDPRTGRRSPTVPVGGKGFDGTYAFHVVGDRYVFVHGEGSKVGRPIVVTDRKP